MNCSLCGAFNFDEAISCASCGASLSREENASGDALVIGTTLQNGSFRIDAVLGQGGFGITYRGFDLSLQRAVAIKEFFPFGCRRNQSSPTVQPSQSLSAGNYATFKTRFVEEARVLARFKHPSIVDVYAVWEENNAAYMVMELLEGQTLEQLLHERNAPLEESEVLDFATKIGAALDEVHRHNLLHRDIKPANIILCNDGRVMLIDFGTAREYSQDSQKTLGHSIVVTPGYAPLEQYAERATRGAYTDIHSLSATLYHLLTGEMPPAASDRALGVELRSARELNPKVSPTVAAALSCAMQTQVAQRPQSVDEFLQMLRGEIAPTTAKSATPSTRSASASQYVTLFPLEEHEAQRRQTPNPDEHPSLSYTPKYPLKEKSTFNENATFDETYERMSLEARAKLEATFGASPARDAFLQSFPPELVDSSRSPPQQLSPNEARRQLLKSLPLSPAETAQRDALAKLATTRSVPTPPLPTAKNMFPPSQFPSGSSVGVKVMRDYVRKTGISIGICILFLIFVAVSITSKNNSGQPNVYSPTTQETTDTDKTADEFFRNQGFEPQAPFLSKELPGKRFDQLESALFSGDGKTMVVFESQNYQAHIYAVPSLKSLGTVGLGRSGDLRLSTNGALMTNCDGKKITLWRTRDGKKLHSWSLRNKYAQKQGDYALSPDGKHVIALTSLTDVTLWSTKTGEVVSQTRVPPKTASLVFTHDSKRWFAFLLKNQKRYLMLVHEMTSRKVVVKNIDTRGTPKSYFNYPDLLTDALLLTSSNGRDATFIDLKQLKVTPHYAEGVKPPSWPANFIAWPMAWSKDARLVLCQTSRNGEMSTFVRQFDPQTTTFGRTALLSSSSNQQVLGGGFSSDNKTLYALNQNGQLLAWHIADLSWQ